jgi:hypothetical protein
LGYEEIRELVIDSRSGFCLPDLVNLFLLVSGSQKGRIALMKDLKLGEATVKTMLKFLRNRDLIEQDTKGVRPTRKWVRLFSFCSAFSLLPEVKIPGIEKRYAAALLVKGASGSVRSGLEQRDEGVRLGAEIVTLVMKDNRLVLAGVPDHELPFLNEVDKLFDIEDNDVVILSCADNCLDAVRGAIAAGLTVALN